MPKPIQVLKTWSFFLLLSFVFFACEPSGSTDTANLQKTEAGFPYKHHVQSEGPQPQVGDQITYHETITKNDTSVLFSSIKTGQPRVLVLPARATLKQPTPPQYDALFLMSVGDSLTVYQSLDTVSQLPPQLSNEDVLTYHLKLVSIKTAAELEEENKAIDAMGDDTRALIEEYKNGKLDGQLKTTESGLKYLIQEEGTGVQPTEGQTVKVHYYGFKLDGESFDNSYQRGRTLDFPLGQGKVIPGWDEGIALLKEGTKAVFFIPSDLGYGDQGNPPAGIPGGAELVFSVELVDVVQ